MIHLSDPLLAELKRIELRTRRSVSNDLIGNFRAAFRGSGLVFSDLREYAPGDDIRHIHWKATARSARPYVKSFEEDRQLNIILAVDVSRSTLCGGGKSKHRKALEFSALLTLLAQTSQDSIGLLMFSDKVEEYMPVKRNRTQFKRVLATLMEKEELTPRTDLAQALSFLTTHQKKPAIIFLISDFYCAPFEHELSMLAHRHDIVGVCLSDALDSELKPLGLVEFEDAESGRRMTIDTSKASAQQLRALQDRRFAALKETFRNHQSDFIVVRDNLLTPLADLMQLRTKRH